MKISEFSEIQNIIVLKEPFEKLWTLALKFHEMNEIWMNGPIKNINPEQVESEV
jgi:dynein heavy chain